MSDIKILLVDDESEFRDSTARTLSRRGFEVDGVCGGREALEYLKIATPDLVILDLKMKDMDGITTLKQIRQVNNDLPVIILTGHGDFDSALSGIKLEIVDFLQKPVDVDQLALRINHLLVHKRTVPLTEKSVEELMIPIDSYKSVYIDERVSVALQKLMESLDTPISGKILETGHRSILVKNRKNEVVGLLRMIDVIGMSIPDWMFDDPYRSFYTGMFLAQCKVISDNFVGEYIEEEMFSINEYTPLIEVAVLMAENCLINIPVMRNNKVIGIVRDKDVFKEVLQIVIGE